MKEGGGAAMAQWTIDPRQITGGQVSSEVSRKALAVFEARVIVRRSRRSFHVPSWTDRGRTYTVVVVAAPDGWKASCSCDSTGWCHHGYAAALELQRLDGLDLPIPRPVDRRPGPRTRFTVVQGGAR
jgi:hypothetical protein